MLPPGLSKALVASVLLSSASAQYGVYPSTTYTFSGCYAVAELSCNETSAALDSHTTHVSAGFTISACASLCSASAVFSLQNGTTCTCATTLSALSPAALVSVDSAQCGSACTQSGAPCGAADRLQVYTHTNFTPPIPYTSGAVFPYLGCVPAGNISTSATQRIVSPDMTRVRCVDYCLGSGMYYYFATQGGNTCYCSSALPATAAQANDSLLCDSPCSGNSSESCGGQTHISLYGKPQSLAIVGSNPYYYQGCFPDISSNTTAGLRANKTVVATDMDVDSCRASCEGYPNFGVEAGSQCHCTNDEAWRGTAVDNGLCGTSCAGAPELACGGYGYVSMYTNPALRKANPAMVDGYNVLSCWTNSGEVPSLDLSSASSQNNMTLDLCRDWCDGYEYFAVGNGSTCYCGNSLKGGAAADVSCNVNCSGNGSQWCGGAAHINVYKKANLLA